MEYGLARSHSLMVYAIHTFSIFSGKKIIPICAQHSLLKFIPTELILIFISRYANASISHNISVLFAFIIFCCFWQPESITKIDD